MIRTLSLAFLALCLTSHTARSAVVAIIDSGTDPGHADLAGRIWTNPEEPTEDAVDNDWNGYVDDIHGWNFAENNRHLFDRSLLGTFSPDVYKFFDLQLRGLQGTLTEEDRLWIAERRKDPAFMKELMTFGNFVHGTHVAAIAARDATDARIMTLKLIPTKALSVFAAAVESKSVDSLKEVDPKDFLIKMGLKALASAQVKNFKPISKYLKKKGAKIANCSFGTSEKTMQMVLAQLLKMIFRRDATPEELKRYSSYFMEQILGSGGSFAKDAPETFFVIAAGNDGVSNEESGTFPANLRLPNTLTVAATHGLGKLASFSNHGPRFVDVAAPGVGILSAIPGNERVVLSGTSQASPFVANVAGRLLDSNPKLTHAQLREILMKTVDFKDFLKGKVAAEGIVNPARAVHAAELSRTQDLASAITEARMNVMDLQEENSTSLSKDSSPLPIAFPALFE